MIAPSNRTPGVTCSSHAEGTVEDYAVIDNRRAAEPRGYAEAVGWLRSLIVRDAVGGGVRRHSDAVETAIEFCAFAYGRASETVRDDLMGGE